MLHMISKAAKFILLTSFPCLHTKSQRPHICTKTAVNWVRYVPIAGQFEELIQTDKFCVVGIKNRSPIHIIHIQFSDESIWNKVLDKDKKHNDVVILLLFIN